MIDGVLQFELPAPDAPFAPSGMLPTFIVGPENALVLPPLERLLHSADLTEAARLFNPLVLVGPSGSGKSQLACAIVRHWRTTLEPSHVEYFTAADFGREAQAAAAEERLDEWHARIRQSQVLVFEDLQRVRPRTTIHQVLRHAIDEIVGHGGLIVVTADRDLRLLTELDLGVRDRLAAGLIVRLQRPQLAARQAIQKLAANSRSVVHAGKGELQLSPNGGQAHPANGLSNHAAAVARLKHIIAVTARYFAVTQSALTGPSRRSSLVKARNIVVHLARRLTPLSYAEIGHALGGRDHTTIMHADRRLADQLTGDSVLEQALDELQRLLG